MHMCPVCGYKGLRHPPENHLICPSCGTQFGYSDVGSEPKAQIWAGLRLYWIKNGQRWHSKVVQRPLLWNADQQLIDAKLFDATWRNKLLVTAA